MTSIICYVEECKYQFDDTCTRSTVTIGSKGDSCCSDYIDEN